MFFSLLSLGLPGGDQVDGLPPAASLGLGLVGVLLAARLFVIEGLFSKISCISYH